MFCPQCRTEVQPGYRECPTCGSRVVHELPDLVATDAGPVVAGRALPCPVCGGGEFDSRSVILDRKGLTVVGLEWEDRPTDLHICKSCGHIMWFAR
jgi:RNA polymerase subunit RPABC4/transcription elongation factor Spt4